ncbi:unnamed protein product [Arctogadus glacialis]
MIGLELGGLSVHNWPVFQPPSICSGNAVRRLETFAIQIQKEEKPAGMMHESKTSLCDQLGVSFLKVTPAVHTPEVPLLKSYKMSDGWPNRPTCERYRGYPDVDLGLVGLYRHLVV